MTEGYTTLLINVEEIQREETWIRNWILESPTRSVIINVQSFFKRKTFVQKLDTY